MVTEIRTEFVALLTSPRVNNSTAPPTSALLALSFGAGSLSSPTWSAILLPGLVKSHSSNSTDPGVALHYLITKAHMTLILYSLRKFYI